MKQGSWARKILATGGILLATISVSGCTTNITPRAYNERAVGTLERAERGEIESFRYIEITSDQRVGTAAGIAAGAAAGSSVGDGAEGLLGAIGGAIVGGVVGNAIDKKAGTRSGFEYVIRTEQGDLVTLVQADRVPIPEGAPVLIIYGRDMTRLVLDESRIEYSPPPSVHGSGGAGGTATGYYGRIRTESPDQP